MEKRWLFLIGIILFVGAIMFDQLILSYIMNDFLLSFIILITSLGSFYGVFFLGFLIFLYDKKLSNFVIYLVSLILAVGVGWIIKFLIARPRPEVVALISENASSFPSLHATAVFSVLPLIITKHPYLKSYWLVFAVLVLFSRVYLGVHYPSDVFGGMLLGLGMGYLVLYVRDEL